MRKLLLVLLVLLTVALVAAYRYQDSLRQYPGLHRILTALPGFRSEPLTATPPPPPSLPAVMPTPLIKIKDLPITLPLLDAMFFVDRNFVPEMKSQMQLSDEMIEKIRQMARAETQLLRESETGEAVPSTTVAGERAAEKINELLGPEQTPVFADFVLRRWQQLGSTDDDEELAVATATPLGTLTAPPGVTPSPSPSPIIVAAAGVFTAPPDTRIVVNAPSYRMDVFENGQLVKSYKAAMGVPEFPVPTGLRKAGTIIFNPTWTPPDEAWVARDKVGKAVAAGDKLNPLGVIKIPIGAPLLIHGGKPLTKIGTLASHGCVGLTDKQVQDFAKLLGRLGGIEVTDNDLAARAADRTQTKNVKLKQPIPVELRYETILVEDGKLHLYADIYNRDANRRENLETVLQSFGVSLNDLSESERAQVETAMKAFFPAESAATPTPVRDKPLTAAEKAAERKQKLAQDQAVKKYKAAKGAVIEIAALAGKGYPAPTELDTGAAPKAAAAAVGATKGKGK